MDRTEKRVKEVEEQKRGTRLEAQITRKSQDLGCRQKVKCTRKLFQKADSPKIEKLTFSEMPQTL